MKKNLLILCLTLTAALLLIGAGCEKTKTETLQSPYVGGTQGVVAGFEDMGVIEENIETIWEGNAFPIQVNLKNKGEEDVASGVLSVTLKGILIGDFSGIDEKDGKKDGIMVTSEALELVSDFNKDGGETNIDFGDAIYNIPIAGSFYDLGIFAEIVYLYKTHVAVPRVCFNGDPTDTTICDVDGKKDVFSSGAPIQVKSVEEKSAGKGLIALTFEVENVGGGDSAMPTTEFNPRYDEISYVLTPETERSKWECSSGGRNNEARLIEDKTTIRCKLKTENKLAEDTLYTKQIGLEISYQYKDLIQKQLRIQKEG